MLKYNLNNQYDNKTYTSVTDNLTNAVQYEEDREKLTADEVDKKDEVKPTVDEGNKVKPTADEVDKKDEVKPTADEVDKKDEVKPTADEVDKKDEVKPTADEVDKKDEVKPTVDEGNKVKPTVDECKLHPCCKYYYNLCFNDCYDSCCSNHDVAWFNTCDDGNTVMLNTTWDWEIELPGIIWYPEFFDFGYSELMLI
ncbi:hypothetical protein [Wolbachia endosymbiont (group B) of Camptogramma bilineatum]|uniref:hypothetical protein n=1 Tax=Wolbachia endosymbiont (group B) of Camptogramma bilineatum TaxID=2953991 RepID=UPI00222E2A26|nr:hypothetical protein [Wolbachia endosymbiont (group B) of Camptogramma bilineatum]